MVFTTATRYICNICKSIFSSSVTTTPLLSLQAFITAVADFAVSNVDITLDGKIYRIMFDFVRKVKKKRNKRSIPTLLNADDFLEFSQPIEILTNSTNFTIIKVTSRTLED